MNFDHRYGAVVDYRRGWDVGTHRPIRNGRSSTRCLSVGMTWYVTRLAKLMKKLSKFFNRPSELAKSLCRGDLDLLHFRSTLHSKGACSFLMNSPKLFLQLKMVQESAAEVSSGFKSVGYSSRVMFSSLLL